MPAQLLSAAVLLVLLIPTQALRDSRSLTCEVCGRYTPLYAALDRVTKLWESRGGLTQDIVSNVSNNCPLRGACANFKLYNNTLWLGQLGGGYETRLESVITLMDHAVQASTQELPNIEFSINVHDFPGPSCVWSFVNKLGEGDNFIMPDQTYYAWPEAKIPPWTSLRYQIQRVGTAKPFRDKDSRGVWRGVVLSHARAKLMDVVKGRDDLYDVKPIDWGQVRRKEETETAKAYMSAPDYCRYKYNIYTEGESWSGRMKYLLLCHSVVISHALHWEFLVSPLLKHDHNIVFVDAEFVNLTATVEELNRDVGRAERIAMTSAAEFSHLLTGPGISCYFQELMRRYARLQRFEVQPPGDEYRSLSQYIVDKIKKD